MKLKDIININAGTLIKGLKITSNNTLRFSPDGWIDGKTNKGNNGAVSSTKNPQYSFVFYKNKHVSKLIEKDKIQIYKPGEITYSVLEYNGKKYFEKVKNFFEKGTIKKGDCIGMSLGENFIAIQPLQTGIYRPDFYEIYVFHKILIKTEPCWIVLRAKTQYRGLLIMDPDKVLLDIEMDLL